MADSNAQAFGERAIRLGYLTPAQVEAAIRAQGGKAAGPPLGQVLIAQGALTAEQAAEVQGLLASEAAPPQGATLPPGTANVLPGRDAETLCASRPPGPGPDPAPAPSPAAGLAAAGTPAPALSLAAPAPRAGVGAGAGPAPSAVSGRFGKYELLEILGRGGMGIVYRARDLDLRREVALKTLLPGAADEPESVERFLREARLAAALNHPAIVPIHDVGTIDGVPYFAMAYLRGRTFHDLLEAHDLPGLRERVAVVHAAAEAVAHAHERGVIHRDLKPRNLLVDTAGQVHVLDFGLARQLDAASRMTATGQILGTPQYMPPEQADADSGRIGPPADVYGLGAVLYEALTGRPPFVGSSMAEILHQVYEKEPEPPRRLDPRIPQDLETVCLKALAKEPARRYPGARELADELGRYLRGEAIQAHPESLLGRGLRWARRRKAVALLAGAAVVAVVLAGALGWRARAAERERTRLVGEVLHGLRELAASNVSATLLVRRAGRPMAEAEELFRRPLEEAARRAVEAAPDLAEPHFYLGRMYRALLRFGDAEREQDRALAQDPDYAPSLYERAILGARAYRERLEVAHQAAWMRAGAALRESGKLVPGAAGPESVPAPTVEELERQDGELRREKEQAITLLERLQAVLGRDPAWTRHERPLLRVGAAKVACVRGLLAVHRGRGWEAARTDLEAAIAGDRTLEEAYEALWSAGLQAGRHEDAIAACTRGLAVDAGYISHWLNRGSARVIRGLRQVARGEDPGELFGAAVADFGSAIDLAPDSASAWMSRGSARLNWGLARSQRGADPTELYAGAIADLGKALDVAPALADAWIRRGAARMNWGIYQSDRGGDPAELYAAAIADYGKAIDLDPRSALAWTGRGMVHLNRGTHALGKGADPGGHFAAAIADFGRALERNPVHVEAWLRRGKAAAYWGVYDMSHGIDPGPRYTAAIADYGKAIELDAACIEAWVKRGAARMNWGNFKLDRGQDPGELFAAAIEEYGKALALNPAAVDAWVRRADTRGNWARFKLSRGADPAELLTAAISDYGKALELNPASSEAAMGRGVAQLNWGTFKMSRGADPGELFRAAIADLGRAVEINPRNVDAWIQRGLARMNWAGFQAGQGADPGALYAAAIEDCGQALALNPNSFLAWLRRGTARANWASHQLEHGADPSELLAGAVADCGKAVELNRNSAEAWLGRGFARMAAGDLQNAHGQDPTAVWTDAAADIQAALRLNPNQPQARQWLANVHAGLTAVEKEKAKKQ